MGSNENLPGPNIGHGINRSLFGTFLGTLLQFVLPTVFADFLPVTVHGHLKSVDLGFRRVLVALLFALLPLLKIRKVSPMATLRPEEGESKITKDPLRWGVVSGILLFIFGFRFFLLNGWKEALGFTGFVVFAFLALWSVALGIMWLIKRFLPITLQYPVRQSLANLYRPNNQTVSLIATIRLGTAMISTLFFVQNQLLDEARFADKEDQPNMLLFDIQTHQVDSVAERIRKRDLPILQQVPIVTMGLNPSRPDQKANDTLPDEERRSRGSQ